MGARDWNPPDRASLSIESGIDPVKTLASVASHSFGFTEPRSGSSSEPRVPPVCHQLKPCGRYDLRDTCTLARQSLNAVRSD